MYTERDRRVDPSDVLGALVLAARRLPPEFVEALLPAYVRRERAERDSATSDEPLEQ